MRIELKSAEQLSSAEFGPKPQQLFGDQSALAQAIKSNPIPSNLHQILTGWCSSDPIDKLLNRNGEQPRHVAQAISQLSQCYAACNAAKSNAVDPLPLLKIALDSFSKAFPATSSQHTCTAAIRADLGHNADLLADPLFKGWMGLKDQPVNSFIFWLAHDLFLSWSTSPAVKALVETSQAVTLPVLFANNKYGCVLWLTVELLPCTTGAVFTPDVRYLGLMNITSRDSAKPNADQDSAEPDHDNSLVAVADRMWQKSGLGQQGWRGRWRLETLPPAAIRNNADWKPLVDASDHENQNLCPDVLRGRSVEAAFLCALLAASGDPYREFQDRAPRPPEPLDPMVIVSACVNSTPTKTVPSANPNDAQDPLLATTVDFVSEDSLGQKLQAAISVGIQTVFLANNQEKVQKEMTGPLQEKVSDSSAEQVRFRYGKELLVASVSTIRQALDELLLTNQALRRFQEDARDQWLSNWCDDKDGRNTGMSTLDDPAKPWNRILPKAKEARV